MPFIENGRVVERRSMMRAGTIADIFWGLLNTIYAFFHCMFSVCPVPPHGMGGRAAGAAPGRALAVRIFCVRAARVCAHAALRSPAAHQRPWWLCCTPRCPQTCADDPAGFLCASRGPAARRRPRTSQPFFRPAACTGRHCCACGADPRPGAAGRGRRRSGGQVRGALWQRGPRQRRSVGWRGRR